RPPWTAPVFRRHCRTCKTQGARTMNKRILVIDEHDLVRIGIAAMLQDEADYAVHDTAVRSRQALRQISVTAPDLVILDPFHAHALELNLLDDMRARPPSLPLLLLTDNANPADITRALQQRVNGYMLKSSPGK